jgi:hypothetical protein
MTSLYFFTNVKSYAQRIEEENQTQLSYMIRRFNWSRARWKKEHCKHLGSRLYVLPLECGVMTDVINLDKVNLFLLGLRYCGALAFYHLISGLLLFHSLVSGIALNLMHSLLPYECQRIKKPPDKQMVSGTAMVACSSGTERSFETIDVFQESFDKEEMAIVGLDSLCSRHLFYDKSNFITKIVPVQPFSIQGVGGNIKAIGIGTVRLRFHDSTGVLHDKVLENVYYAPKSPVRLISIPQLARDTNETSSLCNGGNESTLIWDGVKVLIAHPSPSDIPFLNAYLGNPRFNAFYSTVQLFGVGFTATTSEHDRNNNLDSPVEIMNHATNDTTIDLSEDITKHVSHLQSLLRAPCENIRQQEYLS